ncbi:Immunoglobulin domain-containing protein oig-4 [Parelaphostrongylus tenuis]|uniref:Immunoglobulin domain-containing protein oig-4 n=1 Tax=Parelaphostrongylus tenuis TaxID=148309 RepID=A0AAD5WFB8_PARTN|nr:Immunoglobulin domain-containing protein oig-4 [Parelaphostrongylus tenuis]
MRRLFLLFILLVGYVVIIDSRGGRRGGKGKGKNNLQFAQVAEFSLIHTQLADNRSAHIVTGSHFSQSFRLGYKLIMICKAKGDPRPTIKWYKESAELHPKHNIHYYEKPIDDDMLWSKLEIDPATMGDQGVYACVANNEHGVMAKNFKVEYSY